ncbi:ABC transporter permease [Aeromicrobium fastidiosum]|uniref:ABC transporter permease n=1 Tax=Aeromicrobium fastidiosum TaxID=52699 RepID=A0A641AMW4_9ACTN|nr:ABC transporter permease [Aeromicrobium fastidiosum]KAA1378620.1 ABC transporter permease [Aeromicrobium fastidiosum]MBP2392401.1 ABC-2 type transport system permease protein [Aeromicrobium fastidiosum]
MSTVTSTTTPTPASTDDEVRGAWRVVAEREITTRVREKTYLYSALFMVVGVIAIVVLTSILGGRPTDYTVGVTDQTSAGIVSQASAVVDRSDDGSTARAKELASTAAAEKAVKDGDVDAALIATDKGYEVVGDDEVDSTLSAALSSVATTQALQSNAQEQGVDLQQLQSGTTVSERLLDPKASDDGGRQLAAYVFLILFYITAITFGMSIAQSVVQEKESRVVEILAAAVPIRAMLWGKIAGNTLLAFAQILLLAVAGIASLAAVGQTDLLSALGPAVGMYVVFFVLGFVALAGLWAVAGSLASRQEDLQSTTMPGQVLLFAPYIIAFSAGAGVKTVVSMLPIMSAMLMPSRMAEGGVPVWQIAVAVVVNIVGAILIVRLAARLYERTLMRTERKIGFGEALRLSE